MDWKKRWASRPIVGARGLRLVPGLVFLLVSGVVGGVCAGCVWVYEGRSLQLLAKVCVLAYLERLSRSMNLTSDGRSSAIGAEIASKTGDGFGAAHPGPANITRMEGISVVSLMVMVVWLGNLLQYAIVRVVIVE